MTRDELEEEVFKRLHITGQKEAAIQEAQRIVMTTFNKKGRKI